MVIAAASVEINHQPFPNGTWSPFLEHDRFADLRRGFPSRECFMERSDLGVKLVLNEHRSPDAFRQFLLRSPSWRDLYLESKTHAFVERLVRRLHSAGVDLCVSHLPVMSPRLLDDGRTVIRPDEAVALGPARLECRMELFRSSASGGCHRPHTDRPGKLASFVIGFNDDSWAHDELGSLSICRATETKNQYNYGNRYLDFDEVEVIRELPHRPNVANVIVKTHDSYHAVFPQKCVRSHPDRLALALQLYVAPLPFR